MDGRAHLLSKARKVATYCPQSDRTCNMKEERPAGSNWS